MGADFRGDPSSALLEVLDPEQNFSFRDHYLDLPFDLSKVLFITHGQPARADPAAAARPHGDHRPLRLHDRGEARTSPATTSCRSRSRATACARSRSPSRTRRSSGSSRSYTREAGVRNLEREIGDGLPQGSRARSPRPATGRGDASRSTVKRVHELLGPPRIYARGRKRRTSDPGVATGLAWTPVGGDILFIEATAMPGTGNVTVTGQLGDVMKESAQAALSYVRAHAARARHRRTTTSRSTTCTSTSRPGRSPRTARRPA